MFSIALFYMSTLIKLIFFLNYFVIFSLSNLSIYWSEKNISGTCVHRPFFKFPFYLFNV